MARLESTRVMPWADWSEWNELREMVLNEETEQAAERVALYRLRRRDAVPIRMESTVSLMRQLENPHTDPHLQRLALSMTLIRLVNGTTDQLQPRGDRSIARSVYSLAVELNLPLILVEIRHQASHNALPRLSVLEAAAQKALLWLHENYWEPQSRCISSSLESTTESIKKVFEDVASDQSIVLSDNDPRADEATHTHKEEYENCNTPTVLHRLRNLAGKLAREKDSAADPMSSQHTTAKKPRWTLCENNKAWVNLPLGLVPGQTRIPRLTNTRSMPWQPLQQPDADLTDDVQCETGSTDRSKPSVVKRKRLTPAFHESASDPDHRIRIRKLSSNEEESYVAKKTEEFSSLLQETHKVTIRQ